MEHTSIPCPSQGGNILKRILCTLVLMFAFSFLFSNACASDVETILITADDFYDQQYENAVAACDSDTFEIGYRVCKVADELQTEKDVRLIQYDLILTNKTDKTLNDLCFAAHFRDSLQIILANPNWYNEPMDLGSADQDEIPSTVIYTWNPFVVLKDLGALQTMELTDFYDVLLEITWQDGSELILLDTSSVNIPERVSNSLTENLPFDEEELASMIECGQNIIGQ